MMSTNYEGLGFPFMTFCIHGLNFFRIRQFTIHVTPTLYISYYSSSWHGGEGDTPVEQVIESTSCSSSWSRWSQDKYYSLHQQWMKTTYYHITFNKCLYVCHTDLTCFDEVYFTVLSFKSQVSFGYITRNFDILKLLSNIYVYSVTCEYSITLLCKPQICICEFFWLAYSICKSHTL
jgi:hypothetical protein